MRWIRDWTIRTRLLLAFLAVLVPFAAFLSIAQTGFETLWRSFVAADEEAKLDLKRTADVTITLNHLLHATEAYVGSGSQEERRQIESYLAQLHEAFRLLGTTPFQVPEETVWFEHLRGVVLRIEALGHEILAIPDLRADRDARAKVTALAQQAHPAEEMLARLTHIHLSEIRKAAQRASYAMQQVAPITFAAVVLSAFGGVSLAFFFAGWLSRPILAIAEGSRRMAEGDLSQRVEVNSGGELGEAAQAFNEMAERLEQSAIENARLHDELERKVEERTAALQRTQAQLIQSGKLAAVGTLAAGVAHELNQPLMVIRGYAQELLGDGRLANEEIREDLRRIEGQTTRMVAIINHLRDFSRQSKGKRQVVDLNQVVTGALAFLGQQLKTQNIAVVQELVPALPPVWADPLQIEQVLLNLITNARDAMEEAGMGTIIIRTELAQGSRVALSVTDTGPGIPEKLQARIFDPFFTTKEVGKGTGLGLSICHGIVAEHGGELRVESPVAEGGGARFTIVLPLSLRVESERDRA